jgi:hypothetical protein
VAGRASLSVRPSIRFAAVIAMVIALHAWVLQWLSSALDSPARLRPMATPMFTRLLQPETPPPQQAQAPKPAPAKKRGTMAAVAPRIAKPAAKPASSPASEPQVAASTPVPAPVTETLPPVAAASSPASAPQVAASGPVAAASATPNANANPGASLDTWPVDTRLSYRLSGWYRGELTGRAHVQWLRQKEHYETRVDLDLGLVGYQFLSQGEVAGDTLAPRAYQESTPNRTRVVQLGPENVVLNDGRTVGKPAGVQDTASQFVELSHRFSTGKEQLVVGGTTSVWLARPGGVDLWTYDIVSRERLNGRELGTIEAFHLKPRPIKDARGNIYAEIWLAPSLQYLPVRIRITQPPDSYVDILVDRIEQR